MVYLNDCQWEDTDEVMAAMKQAMCNNTNLGRYDLKHNAMSEEGIQTLISIIEEATHVNQITVSEFISGESMNDLMEALAKNKPAKGKKGKKKKWTRRLNLGFLPKTFNNHENTEVKNRPKRARFEGLTKQQGQQIAEE